jgi:hypothetical protein
LRRLVRERDGLVHGGGRGEDAPDPTWPLYRITEDRRLKNGVLGEGRREGIERFSSDDFDPALPRRSAIICGRHIVLLFSSNVSIPALDDQ